MVEDGRLVLDDDGRPVESAPRDLDDGATTGSRAGRALDAALTGAPGLSPVLRRVLAVGVGALLVGGLLVVLRAPSPPATPAEVSALSAEVLAPPDPAATPRILVSYAVRTGAGTPPVRIVGLDGDGITTAEETVSARGPGTQSFVVDPDCARVLAPGDLRPHAVVISSVAPPEPSTAPTVVHGAELLSAAAVRACWASVASRGLSAVAVTARPGSGPWTALEVVVRNGSSVAMSVTAVDVANVDTLSSADVRTLQPEESGAVRVRLPIGRCTDGSDDATASTLTWSVGRPGAAPSAYASTQLTTEQHAAVAAAVRDRCGPPPSLSAEIVDVRTTRDGPVDGDRGLSLVLALRVVTDATAEVMLGDDAGSLTADARPAFTAVALTPRRTPQRAEVVWHTRCGSAATEPALPASSEIAGLTYSWSIRLAGPSLLALRDTACA